MISPTTWLSGTWPARAAAGLAVTVLVFVMTAKPAWADDPAKPADGSAMNTFDLTDSHGVRISQYQMSIDGGGLSSPGKFFWSQQVLALWEIYRWFIGMLAWAVDWVIGFSWLTWVSKPFNAIATSLKTDVIDKTLLVSVAMAIGSFVVGWWIIKGRHASGIAELIASGLILTLATGALANPVAMITGNAGPLTQARNAGVEVANLITSAGKVSSDDSAQLKANTSGMIVDTFIRVPHQLINFNTVLDQDKNCSDAYTKALQGGPYKSDDDALRSAVGKCNKQAKEYADNPGAGMLMPLFGVGVSGVLLGLFALFLSMLLFVAVLMALYEAVKLIISLIIGVIPGASRVSVIDGLANLAAMVLAVFSLIVVLGGYLFVVRSVFADAGGVAPMARFLLADLILIAGLVILWKVWKSHTKAAESMRGRARKFAAPKANKISRPSVPARISNWATAAPANAQHRELLSALNGSSAGAAGGGGAGAAGKASGFKARSRAMAGQATNLLNGTNAGHSVVLAGQGAKVAGKGAKVAGKLAVTAGKYALMSTIGAPVYAPRAAKVAKAAMKNRGGTAGGWAKKKAAAAGAFKDEYVGNTAAAGRAAGRAAGVVAKPVATGAKAAARPVQKSVERRRRPIDPSAVEQRGRSRASTIASGPRQAMAASGRPRGPEDLSRHEQAPGSYVPKSARIARLLAADFDDGGE